MVAPSAQAFNMRPLAVVSSSRSELVDDQWGPVVSTINLVPPFDERSIRGLDAFSHIEVVFVFDQVDPDGVHLHARRPRGNPSWPEVGILAQRAKDRFNRIGLTTCELLSCVGISLEVRGLDAVDGTPVLDIKPYMSEFAPRGPARQPQWSHELMADYF